MKRKTAWLVIIGFLSQLFLLGVNAFGALPKNYGEPSGYWKMVESQEEIPEDEIFTTEFSDGYKRYGRSGTNLSFDWGAENRDYEPAVIVDGTVQGNYSKPPEIIKPYEPISFKVDLVVGHSSSVPVEFFDEVVAKIEFYASIDARDSVLEARVPITSNSSTSESMDVVFMPSNGLVNEMSIQIYLHGVSDLGGPMFIDYNYEWVEEEILLEKTIDLKGITLNAIGNPMPWMKLEIYVYYGTDVLDRDRDSDEFFTGVTDHQGRYQFTIPVPEDSKGPVGIFIKAYLDSYYPFEQDRLLFRMVDHSDSQSVDQGFIAVGTWTVVKEESLKQVENDQTLKHYRLLAFYNLPLNALSMDAMTMPEPLFLFTGNQNQENQVGKLEDFSILYSAAHEAWFFGGALLDEKEALMDNPVTINFNSTETSHFDPSSNEIFIEVSCSKRDDYSKFVLLHEFGHYFDYTTNSIDNFRAGRGYKEEDVNHGGYMNKSTSDSYLEGFATAYAGLVEQYSGASVPGIIGGYILTDPPVYKAYGNNGEDEEFAIAALLFQTNQKYDDIQKFWNVISPDRLNFYEYYEAILEDLNSRSPASASWLRQFTIDSGLFKMPFGNGRYDIGEPFKDLNDNGEFDEGEVFADLMYDRDEEGYAMFGNPIEEFREEELIVGKVAPANTTETEPRYTTYQSQDSFLYLSGEIPDYVLVKFNLDQNRNYSALYSVNNKGHVFIPIGSVPVKGRVEVWIPGGNLIWESEISTLQDHKIKAAGSPLPLGEARVDALDFPVEKVKYVATGGDISKEGVLKLKDISQSQLEYLAESSEEASLEELRDAWIRGDYASQKQETPMDETDGEYQNPDSKVNTGDGSSSKASNNGYLLALGGLLLLVFTVAFCLLRRKRKAQSTLQETKKIQENQKLGQEKAKLEEVGQTKGNSSRKYDKSIIATKSLNEEDNQGEKNMEQTNPSYCKYCGEAFKRKDALFCRSCGRKRK